MRLVVLCEKQEERKGAPRQDADGEKEDGGRAARAPEEGGEKGGAE